MNASHFRAELEEATCAKLKNLRNMLNEAQAHKCMVCEERIRLACVIYNPVARKPIPPEIPVERCGYEGLCGEA